MATQQQFIEEMTRCINKMEEHMRLQKADHYLFIRFEKVTKNCHEYKFRDILNKAMGFEQVPDYIRQQFIKFENNPLRYVANHDKGADIIESLLSEINWVTPYSVFKRDADYIKELLEQFSKEFKNGSA